MKINWKQGLESFVESLFYILVMSFALHFLQKLGYIGEFSRLSMVIIWVLTFILGDFLIAWHDKWLLKRRIMKTAREVAKFHGIDPKTLKYNDIKITKDENGILDIEITIEGEDKK